MDAIVKRINGLTGNYRDDNGNCIEIREGQPDINASFQGENNRIDIGEGVSVFGKLNFNIRGNNHHIIIKNGCRFLGLNTINFVYEDMDLIIGENCSINTMSIDGFGKSIISIGDSCTFARNSNIYCHPYSRVVFGKDCMVSFDVVFQTGDGHTIFDLHTAQNTNTDFGLMKDGYLYEIIFGEHVWIGRRDFILGGRTRIGNGSIIGAQSLVKGKFPNNVVVAGSPGRVLKKDVAWSRKSRTNNLEDCGVYTDLTQEMDI